MSNKNYGFDKFKPELFFKETPEEVLELKFIDRNNLNYVIDYVSVNVIGKEESYSDLLRRNLNPVVDNNVVYGYGKVLEPVSVSIQKMRDTINEASAKKRELESNLLSEIDKINNQVNDSLNDSKEINNDK